MSYTLTRRIDKEGFTAELVASGVTSFNMDDTKVYLTGEMTEQGRARRLEIIAVVEAAHVPTNCTEVTLAAPPHAQSFAAETQAAGAIGVGLEQPTSYPGTGYVLHSTASADVRAAVKEAAEAHDPTAFTALTVDTSSTVVVPPDDSTTRTVTVTDSRGADASGKTVRLRIPSNVTIRVDSDAFVLGEAGQAVATFGPSSSITGEVGLEFYYASEEAEPASFSVRFGTP